MSQVYFDEPSRTFLLTTPNSAYALRIDADDSPRHVHWGAPLTLDQVAALPTRRTDQQLCLNSRRRAHC
ncbi:hypothetical protein ACFQ0Q_37545 [Streptomyces aureus]